MLNFEQIWQKQEYFQNILNNPFLQEMAQGTLKEEFFLNYIAQDLMYLNYYAEAVGNLIQINENEKYLDFFRMMKEETHKEYDRISLIYGNSLPNSVESIALLEYKKFILKQENFFLDFSRLVTCPVLYYRVASYFCFEGVQELYQEWFTMNASEDVAQYVNEIVAIADELLLEKGNGEAFEKNIQEALILEDNFWRVALN